MSSDRVTVIAEAGVNHNGEPELALRLVDAAAATGADLVKFQTFDAASLVTAGAPKAAYQERNAPASRSQLEMLRALELDAATHRLLLERCNERGIGFLSTPFDPESVRLLTEGLGLTLIKVSSGDLTNAPLLLQLARSGAALIVSTGMATLEEIRLALGVLAFGYLGRTDPGMAAFHAAGESDAGRQHLTHRVTLLHCTSNYPARLEDLNLRAMATLHEEFGVKVGYSDHSLGITVPIAAAARGASVIEKHLTLDRNMAGPDHAASLEPAEFTAMVTAIREVEQALGSPVKAPGEGEMATRLAARKTIVALRPIAAGELFSADNLTVKRAGEGGLAPIRFWELLGRPAPRTFAADEIVEA